MHRWIVVAHESHFCPAYYLRNIIVTIYLDIYISLYEIDFYKVSLKKYLARKGGVLIAFFPLYPSWLIWFLW